MDILWHVSDSLTNLSGKDRRGTPLCRGMLITKLTKSFGVLQKQKAMMLTMERGKAFRPFLSKMANIVVDNRYGNYSIPNDDPKEQSRKRVRKRSRDVEEEPPIIPNEDELPMDT